MHFSIVTNGTLLTADKLDFIKNNCIDLAISIDGDREITDENRRFTLNRESVYDKVIEKIDLIRQKQVEFSLSITISEYFLNNQESALTWIKKLNVRQIGYNLLKFNKNDSEKEVLAYYKKAANFVIRSYEELGINNNIFEDKSLRKLNSILNREFYLNECSAILGEQITLNPDGSLVGCQGEILKNSAKVGDIYESRLDIFNYEKRNKYLDYTTIMNKVCLDCDSIFICGGGCPLQANNVFSRESVDKGYCEYNKIWLEWILQKMYLYYEGR